MKKYIIKSIWDGIESYYYDEEDQSIPSGAQYALTYNKEQATVLNTDFPSTLGYIIEELKKEFSPDLVFEIVPADD